MGKHKEHFSHGQCNVNGKSRIEATSGRLSDEEYAAMASGLKSERIVGRRSERERRAEYVRMQKRLTGDVVRHENGS